MTPPRQQKPEQARALQEHRTQMGRLRADPGQSRDRVAALDRARRGERTQEAGQARDGAARDGAQSRDRALSHEQKRRGERTQEQARDRVQGREARRHLNPRPGGGDTAENARRRRDAALNDPARKRLLAEGLQEHREGSARGLVEHRKGSAKGLQEHRKGTAKGLQEHRKGTAKGLQEHRKGTAEALIPHRQAVAKHLRDEQADGRPVGRIGGAPRSGPGDGTLLGHGVSLIDPAADPAAVMLPGARLRPRDEGRLHLETMMAGLSRHDVSPGLPPPPPAAARRGASVSHGEAGAPGAAIARESGSARVPAGVGSKMREVIPDLPDGERRVMRAGAGRPARPAAGGVGSVRRAQDGAAAPDGERRVVRSGAGRPARPAAGGAGSVRRAQDGAAAPDGERRVMRAGAGRPARPAAGGVGSVRRAQDGAAAPDGERRVVRSGAGRPARPAAGGVGSVRRAQDGAAAPDGERRVVTMGRRQRP